MHKVARRVLMYGGYTLFLASTGGLIALGVVFCIWLAMRTVHA